MMENCDRWGERHPVARHSPCMNLLDQAISPANFCRHNGHSLTNIIAQTVTNVHPIPPQTRFEAVLVPV